MRLQCLCAMLVAIHCAGPIAAQSRPHPFDEVISLNVPHLTLEEFAERLERLAKRKVVIHPSLLAERRYWELAKQAEEAIPLASQFAPLPPLKKHLAEMEARRLIEPLEGAFPAMRLEAALDELLRPIGCRAVAVGPDLVIARISKANGLYFAQSIDLTCKGERLESVLARLKQSHRLEYAIADQAIGKKAIDVNVRGLSLRDASELSATLAAARTRWIDRTLIVVSDQAGEANKAVSSPLERSGYVALEEQEKPSPAEKLQAKDKEPTVPKVNVTSDLPSPEAIDEALDEVFVTPVEFTKAFSVGDAFAYLEKRLRVVVLTGNLKRINPEAFPDPKAILERTLPGWKAGTKMRLRSFVEAIAKALDEADTTFLIREGEIELLSLYDADPDRVYVRGKFEDL